MGEKKEEEEESEVFIRQIIIEDWRHVSLCFVGDAITDKSKLFQSPQSG